MILKPPRVLNSVTYIGEQDISPAVDGIKCPCLDQTLKNLLINLRYALSEVEDVCVRSFLLTASNNAFYHRSVDAFNSAKAKADLRFVRNREEPVALVDIGNQEINAVIFSVGDKRVHLVAVIHHHAEVGCIEG